MFVYSLVTVCVAVSESFEWVLCCLDDASIVSNPQDDVKPHPICLTCVLTAGIPLTMIVLLVIAMILCVYDLRTVEGCVMLNLLYRTQENNHNSWTCTLILNMVSDVHPYNKYYVC